MVSTIVKPVGELVRVDTHRAEVRDNSQRGGITVLCDDDLDGAAAGGLRGDRVGIQCGRGERRTPSRARRNVPRPEN